jgi:preprotein translocase subunit SecD
MENLKLRRYFAVFVVLLFGYIVLPNLFQTEIKGLPKDKLNYGLDIQGGLHLVMGVDVAGVVNESIGRLSSSVGAELEKEGLKDRVKVSQGSVGEFTITVNNDQEKDKAVGVINKNQLFSSALQRANTDGQSLVYRYNESYLKDFKSRVIQQSIETIRNRIDEFGVAEPSISQQGDNRILIQLPGMADAEKAKSLINTTAKLDFMMVSYDKTQSEIQELITAAEKVGNYNMSTMKYSEYVARLNADLKGKIPENTIVLFEKSPNAQKLESGAIPLLLKTDTGLGGESLTDAYVSYGQYGAPEVGMRFNPSGGAKFGQLTTQNVGKQMAIVLDKVVKSAPNIQNPITNGGATITMGGRKNQNALDEAKLIATALRAGALPASLEQLEERRVGPSLGSDSINKAKIASYVGALIVVAFMMLYYRTMGVIASISLAINILGVFALLTTLGATLTLPGIAGIALTVGFAVDANVLINERIREELAHGGSLKVAIQEGYKRAMSAILDANITTAATALVLLYFGTGPVKGFAVTLLIGIATTLFANVFVSKVIVDSLIARGVQKISV